MKKYRESVCGVIAVVCALVLSTMAAPVMGDDVDHSDLTFSTEMDGTGFIGGPTDGAPTINFGNPEVYLTCTPTPVETVVKVGDDFKSIPMQSLIEGMVRYTYECVKPMDEEAAAIDPEGGIIPSTPEKPVDLTDGLGDESLYTTGLPPALKESGIG